MLDEFVGKKYPSIMIKGIWLIFSVPFLAHGNFNWAMFGKITIVLSLFILQFIYYRFFYYFLDNRFMQKET